MIQSMTAFARIQEQGSWGTAICELRSVNHRYLELNLRLPEMFQALESPLREHIRHYLHRGKVECSIRFHLPDDNSGTEIAINHRLVERVCQASVKISQILTQAAPVNPMDILRWPGVLQLAEMDFSVIQEKVLKLVEKALQDLVETRLREGEELKQLFLSRLDSMQAELAKVRHRLPEIYQQQRARFIARLNEAKVELDSNRFEQEIVLLVQKMDVAEELERLDTHIIEVRRILKQGGVVGRRLDFLMQELNREANTLGAKSVDVDTTRAAVELKVLIEQIREQVQNIE